jgi:hypothetical protein
MPEPRAASAVPRVARARRLGYVGAMKTKLQCPCGEVIEGRDEDDLVEKVQQHLAEKHPDHKYSREEILFLAY